MLVAQQRNPAQRFIARVRQVCYEVRLETGAPAILRALLHPTAHQSPFAQCAVCKIDEELKGPAVLPGLSS